MCARLGIPDFNGLEGDRLRKVAARFDAHDLAAVLIRLFVLGGPVGEADLARALTPAERAALERTGLVAETAREPGSGAAEEWCSPFRLVPIAHRHGDLVIACDRPDRPDGSPIDPAADIVFSAHNPLTRQFLRLLPTSDTGTVVDLCSGTGVAALVAASTALRVTAVDVTDRSTAFARFNCWINDVRHVDVRCGDLFAPVEHERFDRILAHPPYVPTFSDTAIYRDGGQTGDKLLRRIAAAIPDHLSPGGTFHMLTIGMDTSEAPFEARVREWLGAAGDEFDLIFAMGDSKSPEAFARALVSKVAAAQAGDYERWRQLFDELQVRDFVYGALVGRRFGASAGEPQTRRVVAQPGIGPDGFEWLFKWFDWLRLPNRRDRVLNAKPVLVPETTVEVQHVVRDGHFTPATFRLHNSEVPFAVQLQTDGWVVAMMDAFDGNKTAAEVYGVARMARQIPEQMSDEEFVGLICLLVERRLLRWPDAVAL